MESHSHKEHQHRHKEVKTENLLIAVFLNLAITVVEIVGGIFSNSYALISDAIHNFSDSIAIFLAYISGKISKRKPTLKRTFGFKRIEIFAALLNGLALLIVCAFLIAGAISKFNHPTPIKGSMMILVAVIGLMANFIAMALLKEDKDKNINVKAAYLHLVVDTLSSVAVIVGGFLIFLYKIYWIDPIITIIISVYVLKEAWQIIKEAFLIFLQATPAGLDLNDVKTAIEGLPEIDNVHHIHAWKLNDIQSHFECHIDLKKDYHLSETSSVLYKIKKLLKDRFNIEHTTIQFEYNCCADKSAIRN
jgi:cobalt-zinc-cadmium efflux system protein